MGATLIAAVMGMTPVPLAASSAAARPVEAQHQDLSGERRSFGSACGIRDVSPSKARWFARSASGEWSAVGADRKRDPESTGAARVWRDGNWMVDIHDAPGAFGGSVHVVQFCFDAEGKVLHMIDNFMQASPCGCMRFTVLSFAPDGRVTQWRQSFVNARTGQQIDRPKEADEFPEVSPFRRIEQLPFFPLLAN